MSARFDLAAAVPPLSELGAVHFIGVGGVGVSGVARIMLERGVTVSGSDAKDLPVMDALRAGATPEEIHDVTGIDPWFVDQVLMLVELRQAHDRRLERLERRAELARAGEAA